MEKLKITIAGQDFTNRYSAALVRQDMSWHHHFELRLPLADTLDQFKGILKSNADEILGQKVEISIEDTPFIGYVTGLSLSRVRRQENELIITGSSPTIALDQGPHSRSFYEQTLKQIVDSVLSKTKSKFKSVEVSPAFSKKIKYLVQYQESDIHFLTRLAVRFGEWLYYDGENLYFGKKPAQKGDPIKLYQDKTLLHFDLAVKSLPTKFKLAGYDYKQHNFLEKESNYSEKLNEYAEIAKKKGEDEIFSGDSHLPLTLSANDEDLEQLKLTRQKAHVSEMVFLSGSSTDSSLKIGSYIQILDERNGLLVGGTEDYGTYIVTHVEHQAAPGGEYFNSFEAVPSEVSMPPLSQPVEAPQSEMQLAEVMDINDNDALGRVRVQFLWQRSTSEKSPWIRVATPYPGKDKGFYMLPEIGDQVLVAFENNNPDRPYVLTGMYNGEAKPEHHHAENYFKAIKTKGGHQILMNDEKGKEAFGITSPKDVTVEAVSGKMTITAKAEISIVSESGDITIKTPANITIEAKAITLKADTDIKLEAMNITLDAKVGLNGKAAKVAMEAQATNDIKGAMVNVDGSGMTNITGGVIKLN